MRFFPCYTIDNTFNQIVFIVVDSFSETIHLSPIKHHGYTISKDRRS